MAARVASPAESLHAPHLLAVEVAQVLRRYVGAGSVAPEDAASALADLADLDIARYGHEPFLARIWELRENLTREEQGRHRVLVAPVDARVRGPAFREGRQQGSLHHVLKAPGRPVGHTDDPIVGHDSEQLGCAHLRLGAYMTPNADGAASNAPSSKGSSSASASCQSIASSATWHRFFPWATGDRSVATTAAPWRAAAMATFPVPAPTSTTRSPTPMRAAATRASAAGCMRACQLGAQGVHTT